MSLIVTGSVGIDTIETPDGQRADEVLGGSSIYFAAGASYFTNVRLVAAVGDDFPDHLHQQFAKFDVCTQGLEKRAGSKTFRWHGRYHENMNDRDTLEVQINVLGEALPPVPDDYRDSKYVFLANTHPAAQLSLLDQFPDRKLVVADTMDLWIETEQGLLKDLLKRLDGFVLNDSEAKLLTGENNIIRAADAVLAMGPTFVIVKKGEHGAILRHKDGTGVLPAFPARDVVDPTGAGDSFASGMMGYLCEQDDVSVDAIKRAMAYGTVVASYTIEKFSTDRLAEIKRADLDARLAEYTSHLHIGG
ncbi:MAG: PfkB family carbohydrate kinase [Phycisphaerales bacterium JB063]